MEQLSLKKAAPSINLTIKHPNLLWIAKCMANHKLSQDRQRMLSTTYFVHIFCISALKPRPHNITEALSKKNDKRLQQEIHRNITEQMKYSNNLKHSMGLPANIIEANRLHSTFHIYGIPYDA